MSARQWGLFIDNEWVETAASFESLDPATEEPIATLASASPADVDRAVRSARAAFDSGVWSGLSGLERGRMLDRIAALLRERLEDFALAETLDVGKPLFESRNVDLPIAADSLEYYGCLAGDIRGDLIPVGPAALDYTVREPLGVVAAIVPWNFPLVLACRKLGPALAAGNTVVLKPASWAPLTCLMLGEVFSAAGLPPGVVNILTGPGSVTGEALVRHPGVDKLSFTGSTEIGKGLLAASCDSVCACSLELGGKSPAIVLEDADVEATVEGLLFGAYLNQGECCCAATRVLVHRKLHAAIVEGLVRRSQEVVVGPGVDEATRMGPLVSAAHRQTVADYLASGRQECGEPVVGGGVPAGFDRGYFLECTVFDNVPTDSRIYREEIFGPVLVVTPFDTEDELIAAANDTPYGLAASLWTGDAARGQRLAGRLQAGTVWVNVHNFVFNQAPYGGYKQSGLGRELGREGLEAYTQLKNVITWLGPEPLKWY